MVRGTVFVAAVACAIAGASACRRSSSSASPAAAPEPDSVLPSSISKDIVATVNGVPLTAFELSLQKRPAIAVPLGQGADSPLERMITDELYAQRAKELGLESDSTFQEEMARAQAQLNEVRRRGLAKVFLHRVLMEQAKVSDEEARRAYEANKARLADDLRVNQLVFESLGEAQAARAKLLEGSTFEALARARLPAVPAEQPTFESPWLRWEDIPDAWWPQLDELKVNEISQVITAADGRFWLIQLLERRPTEKDRSFEQTKPILQANAASAKLAALKTRSAEELRQKARIERLKKE